MNEEIIDLDTYEKGGFHFHMSETAMYVVALSVFYMLGKRKGRRQAEKACACH